MKWYQYVAVFFSGGFFANAVPHFVNGISGNYFPSPFADPPGIGLSSPLTNVLWGMLNIVMGYALLKFSAATEKKPIAVILFFSGVTFVAILLSIAFIDKMPAA